ncbi:BrnT family toxin [Caballeronia humi]|uniref:BrnT family toxin n=1 Tax=Caballeronia humi TaxID=326474 RepID=UPI002E0DECFB
MTITYDIPSATRRWRTGGWTLHMPRRCLPVALLHTRTCADYGEPRFVTASRLRGRIVMVVWTPCGAARRLISMRKANEREIKSYEKQLG